MTNSQRLASVRQHLESWFRDRYPNVEWSPTESILISDGCYCGRRFIFDPFSAIWFVEEDELKIFDEDGSVAECVDCTQIYQEVAPDQIRRAA